MRKIPTLYKRHRDTGLVYDELTDDAFSTVGCGTATPTIKIDGTCCRVLGGVLWKRYDRKPAKWAVKASRKVEEAWVWQRVHAKEAPEAWEPCQDDPDPKSGHWPGWLPVDGQDPADKWHMEALAKGPYDEGTYELIGPKVQWNPYALKSHEFARHGSESLKSLRTDRGHLFNYLDSYLATAGIEGIVWWADGAPWVKIKASDFGHQWRSK